MHILRRSLWITLVGAIALVATAALATAWTGDVARSEGPEGVTPATRQCPGPLYQPDGQVPGVPAITPRDDCTPSFTADDVLAWAANHSFVDMRMTAVGPARVTRVLFITSKAAGEMLGGTTIGLPDEALVCMLERYGRYQFYPPHGGGSVSERVGLMHEVFDAHTGNLLVSGG